MPKGIPAAGKRAKGQYRERQCVDCPATFQPNGPRDKRCAECRRIWYNAIKRRQYHSHLAQSRLASQRRYRNTRENALARGRRWNENNKLRRAEINLHAKRRRNQQIALGETIDREAVYSRDGWVCGICGQTVDPTLVPPDPASKSLDHITPLVHGGAHSWENVRLTHLGCNIRKGAKT